MNKAPCNSNYIYALSMYRVKQNTHSELEKQWGFSSNIWLMENGNCVKLFFFDNNRILICVSNWKHILKFSTPSLKNVSIWLKCRCLSWSTLIFAGSWEQYHHNLAEDSRFFCSMNPLKPSSLAKYKGFQSTPLHIYGERRGPKTLA